MKKFTHLRYAFYSIRPSWEYLVIKIKVYIVGKITGRHVIDVLERLESAPTKKIGGAYITNCRFNPGDAIEWQ